VKAHKLTPEFKYFGDGKLIDRLLEQAWSFGVIIHLKNKKAWHTCFPAFKARLRTAIQDQPVPTHAQATVYFSLYVFFEI
jgi:hypothetical protein